METTTTTANIPQHVSLSQSLASKVAIAPDSAPYIFRDVGSLGQIVANCCPISNEHLQGSVPISGTEGATHTPTYRNKAFPHSLKLTMIRGLDLYYKLFENSLVEYGKQRCMGYRVLVSDPSYLYYTYEEVAEMRDALGAGILNTLLANRFKEPSKFASHRKIDTHQQDFSNFYRDERYSFVLTLYLTNRPEWMITDLVALAYSITNTALYDTLGSNTSEYILSLTESPVVLTSALHVKRVIDLKKAHPETLGNVIQVVSMDPLDASGADLIAYGAHQNIEVTTWNDVLAKGRASPIGHCPAGPETMYTISFTSGTTGPPKGVIALQKGAAAAVTFNLAHIPTQVGWRYFSFLPLAHIMERQTIAAALTAGAIVGFPPPNYKPADYFDYVKAWKPHVLVNVPRIWNKLELMVKALTVENPDKARATAWFLLVLQRQAGRGPLNYQADIFELSITKVIRREFGFDNLKFFLTGAAPLDSKTINFLKAVFDVGFAQGMGMTETFGGIAMTNPFLSPRKGLPYSCGACSLTCEWRLREIPGMPNHNENGQPRGELQLRGHQVFPGYFKNPSETAAALKDGWYNSGDVAVLDDQGMLYVVDRVKLHSKLAQGEYIAPEKIEGAYLNANPILAQAYVHGDSTASYIFAVLGVDPVRAQEFLQNHLGREVSSAEVLTLLNRVDLKTELVTQLNANVPDLCGFEKIHNVFVSYEPLEGCLTPSLKLQRPVAIKKFRPTFDELYAEGLLIKAAKF